MTMNLRGAMSSVLLLFAASQTAVGAAQAQTSRAAAVAAADAATADAAGQPVCASPPPPGQKIAGDMKLLDEGHNIEIQNGGGGDALVKIRHADTGKLAASFFLPKLETMTIEGVPDGVYKIQYAFGPALAVDCKSFTRIIRANEFPGSDAMKTEVIDTADQTEVKHSNWSYSLMVSESGIKPTPIDAATFNAE
jgi:hypothetical protein